MFEMGSHDPFGHLKHKLWPKEKSGIKLTVWLLTIKSQESPQFLTWRWHATYCWKALDEGYNFTSNLISIGGLHEKLWGLKIMGVPTLGISGVETKCHLDVGLVEKYKVYYKGEGGGFPQVWAVVNLVSLKLPVIRHGTKSAPTMH
jgi:hypothetical protein